MKLPLFSVLLTLLAGSLAAADHAPTKQEQAHFTPQEVLADLMAGNKHYVDNRLTPRDLVTRRHDGVGGQHPKAYVLSCIDSRVPVELVFDQSLGDIFVGRVAGNIENEDQLGSMEYAACVSGVHVILVLGHESCGAVKGAIDHVEMSNLSLLLDKIEPAVEAVKADHHYGHDHGHLDSHDHRFVSLVVEQNVKMTVADIRERSPELVKLEQEGRLCIVGAVYSLQTGKVTLVE
ncbi:MAG: carbonic anhydrase [Puniceicoccaceae bacterium 5H]|nr:MAG: carbonic anhydrase [Puniceicoccaceae bacterium 5H]